MISLSNIRVTFDTGSQSVTAVQDVSLHVNASDVYGIVGYSGAGKSTLVRVINLLQRPASGSVEVNGQDLLALSPKELRAARRKIGMIFQHFNLMNSRTIYDNVDYPLKSSMLSKRERSQKVKDLLELVGLSDKLDAYPSQLSGGQKQRVAIARALANDPEILLCDEATSALDPKTTLSILELLKKLNQTLGLTIVLITHEMQVVKEICNKVAVMEDGRIIEQGDIVSIFSRPQNALTRDFINTATHIEQTLEKLSQHPSLVQLKNNDILCKISYIGDSTSEPIISALTARYRVTTNILYANVEILQQTPIGNLIVVMSGSTSDLEAALEYLQSIQVAVEMIDSRLVQNVKVGETV
ncbi:methionine ABC transporter ATP-binding protein [Paenibacillus popilliae]|uniref:ATP-binding cassette domain-containing protein n=1 Tax=Paenibacillus popilliae TaxID=78057 RepID=A0ABY3ASB7_PAEPP|nr:ATP-binding cassette domain-containing protein [Paenibacillus sp. SDF0028]TQR45507.1 ATP-binding cassette domain-containing protein [Paenibacillus sp. SDF0028]